jgi:hypothetical protein
MSGSARRNRGRSVGIGIASVADAVQGGEIVD